MYFGTGTHIKIVTRIRAGIPGSRWAPDMGKSFVSPSDWLRDPLSFLLNGCWGRGLGAVSPPRAAGM